MQAALAAVEGSAQAAPGYAAVQRAAQRKPARVEDVKALESILGPSVRISPTRFERYISCPFAYFMQYVLGARPRQKAELAPNISGTLTHWVLEQALSLFPQERPYVQLGGNETVGMGWCRVRTVDSSIKGA